MTEPIVKIEQGQLKGKTGKDLNGGTYYSFQGIPYAKPPVGDLRFKAPKPAEPWTGVLDATVEGSESISRDTLLLTPVGTEDCLSINVYTPQLPNGNSKVPKAVMVWIHGGGFIFGCSKTTFYGPEFLVKEDIVLVTFNYRLGILGFLSSDDLSLEVPGNAGLKDMVLALKWVQKNISQFGGDPNNVTIFGESAGSAACHFLILSPLAKGLFHRAILQSGSTLNPWTSGNKNVLEVAKVLGHDSKDEKDALAFLKTVPAEKFIEAQDIIKDQIILDGERPFCPVIEKPHPGAFLTEQSLKLMLSGNYNIVPIIMGYTDKEGMLLELIHNLGSQEKFVYRLPNFEGAIAPVLNVPKGSKTSLSIAKKIEEFYYGNAKTPDDERNAYYDMASDVYFVHGIQTTIKSFLKTLNAPIYLYKFSVDSSLNVYKKFAKIDFPGASHADDLGYLFKNILTPEIDPKSVEGIAVHRMTKLWTNFAKTGNPNPTVKDPLIDVTWQKVTADALNCLDIGEKLSLTKNPDKERVQFWDNICEGLNLNYKV